MAYEREKNYVQSKTVIISQETTFKSTLMYFRNKSKKKKLRRVTASKLDFYSWHGINTTIHIQFVNGTVVTLHLGPDTKSVFLV